MSWISFKGIWYLIPICFLERLDQFTLPPAVHDHVCLISVISGCVYFNFKNRNSCLQPVILKVQVLLIKYTLDLCCNKILRSLPNWWTSHVIVLITSHVLILLFLLNYPLISFAWGRLLTVPDGICLKAVWFLDANCNCLLQQ